MDQSPPKKLARNLELILPGIGKNNIEETLKNYLGTLKNNDDVILPAPTKTKNLLSDTESCPLRINEVSSGNSASLHRLSAIAFSSKEGWKIREYAGPVLIDASAQKFIEETGAQYRLKTACSYPPELINLKEVIIRFSDKNKRDEFLKLLKEFPEIKTTKGIDAYGGIPKAVLAIADINLFTETVNNNLDRFKLEELGITAPNLIADWKKSRPIIEINGINCELSNSEYGIERYFCEKHKENDFKSTIGKGNLYVSISQLDEIISSSDAGPAIIAYDEEKGLYLDSGLLSQEETSKYTISPGKELIEMLGEKFNPQKDSPPELLTPERVSLLIQIYATEYSVMSKNTHTYRTLIEEHIFAPRLFSEGVKKAEKLMPEEKQRILEIVGDIRKKAEAVIKETREKNKYIGFAFISLQEEGKLLPPKQKPKTETPKETLKEKVRKFLGSRGTLKNNDEAILFGGRKTEEKTTQPQYTLPVDASGETRLRWYLSEAIDSGKRYLFIGETHPDVNVLSVVFAALETAQKEGRKINLFMEALTAGEYTEGDKLVGGVYDHNPQKYDEIVGKALSLGVKVHGIDNDTLSGSTRVREWNNYVNSRRTDINIFLIGQGHLTYWQKYTDKPGEFLPANIARDGVRNEEIFTITSYGGETREKSRIAENYQTYRSTDLPEELKRKVSPEAPVADLVIDVPYKDHSNYDEEAEKSKMAKWLEGLRPMKFNDSAMLFPPNDSHKQNDLEVRDYEKKIREQYLNSITADFLASQTGNLSSKEKKINEYVYQITAKLVKKNLYPSKDDVRILAETLEKNGTEKILDWLKKISPVAKIHTAQEALLSEAIDEELPLAKEYHENSRAEVVIKILILRSYGIPPKKAYLDIGINTLIKKIESETLGRKWVKKPKEFDVPNLYSPGGVLSMEKISQLTDKINALRDADKIKALESLRPKGEYAPENRRKILVEHLKAIQESRPDELEEIAKKLRPEQQEIIEKIRNNEEIKVLEKTEKEDTITAPPIDDKYTIRSDIDSMMNGYLGIKRGLSVDHNMMPASGDSGELINPGKNNSANKPALEALNQLKTAWPNEFNALSSVVSEERILSAIIARKESLVYDLLYRGLLRGNGVAAFNVLTEIIGKDEVGKFFEEKTEALRQIISALGRFQNPQDLKTVVRILGRNWLIRIINSKEKKTMPAWSFPTRGPWEDSLEDLVGQTTESDSRGLWKRIIKLNDFLFVLENIGPTEFQKNYNTLRSLAGDDRWIKRLLTDDLTQFAEILWYMNEIGSERIYSMLSAGETKEVLAILAPTEETNFKSTVYNLHKLYLWELYKTKISKWGTVEELKKLMGEDEYLLKYSSLMKEDVFYLCKAEKLSDELRDEIPGARDDLGYRTRAITRAIEKLKSGKAVDQIKEEIILEIFNAYQEKTQELFKPLIRGEIEITRNVGISWQTADMRSLMEVLGIEEDLNEITAQLEFVSTPTKDVQGQLDCHASLYKYFLPNGAYSYHLNIGIPGGVSLSDVSATSRAVGLALTILYSGDERLKAYSNVHKLIRFEERREGGMQLFLEVRSLNILKNAIAPEIGYKEYAENALDKKMLETGQILGMFIYAQALNNLLYKLTDEEFKERFGYNKVDIKPDLKRIRAAYTKFESGLEKALDKLRISDVPLIWTAADALDQKKTGDEFNEFTYDYATKIKENRQTLLASVGAAVSEAEKQLREIRTETWVDKKIQSNEKELSRIWEKLGGDAKHLLEFLVWLGDDRSRFVLLLLDELSIGHFGSSQAKIKRARSLRKEWPQEFQRILDVFGIDLLWSHMLENRHLPTTAGTLYKLGRGQRKTALRKLLQVIGDRNRFNELYKTDRNFIETLCSLGLWEHPARIKELWGFLGRETAFQLLTIEPHGGSTTKYSEFAYMIQVIDEIGFDNFKRIVEVIRKNMGRKELDEIFLKRLTLTIEQIRLIHLIGLEKFIDYISEGTPSRKILEKLVPSIISSDNRIDYNKFLGIKTNLRLLYLWETRPKHMRAGSEGADIDTLLNHAIFSRKKVEYDGNLLDFCELMGGDVFYLKKAENIAEEMQDRYDRNWGYQPKIMEYAIESLKTASRAGKNPPSDEELIAQLDELLSKEKEELLLPTIGGEIEIPYEVCIQPRIDYLHRFGGNGLTNKFSIPTDEKTQSDIKIEYAPNPTYLAENQLAANKLIRNYMIPDGTYSYHISLGLPPQTREHMIKESALILSNALTILYVSNERLKKGKSVGKSIKFLPKDRKTRGEHFRLELRLNNFIKNKAAPEVYGDPNLADKNALIAAQKLGVMLSASVLKKTGGNEPILEGIEKIRLKFEAEIKKELILAGLQDVIGLTSQEEEYFQAIKKGRNKTLQNNIARIVDETTEELRWIQEKETKNKIGKSSQGKTFVLRQMLHVNPVEKDLVVGNFLSYCRGMGFDGQDTSVPKIDRIKALLEWLRPNIGAYGAKYALESFCVKTLLSDKQGNCLALITLAKIISEEINLDIDLLASYNHEYISVDLGGVDYIGDVVRGRLVEKSKIDDISYIGVEKVTDEFIGYISLLRYYTSKARFDDGLKCINKIPSEYQDNKSGNLALHYALGNLYHECGKNEEETVVADGYFEKALDHYAIVLEAHPEAATIWSKKADSLVHLSKGAEAVESYAMTWISDGNYHLKAGLIKLAVGENKAADSEFKKAFSRYRHAVDPDPESRKIKINMLVSTGDAYLKIALAEKERGLVDESRRELGKAIEYYDNALTIKQGNAELLEKKKNAQRLLEDDQIDTLASGDSIVGDKYTIRSDTDSMLDGYMGIKHGLNADHNMMPAPMGGSTGSINQVKNMISIRPDVEAYLNLLNVKYTLRDAVIISREISINPRKKTSINKLSGLSDNLKSGLGDKVVLVSRTLLRLGLTQEDLDYIYNLFIRDTGIDLSKTSDIEKAQALARYLTSHDHCRFSLTHNNFDVPGTMKRIRENESVSFSKGTKPELVPVTCFVLVPIYVLLCREKLGINAGIRKVENHLFAWAINENNWVELFREKRGGKILSEDDEKTGLFNESFVVDEELVLDELNLRKHKEAGNYAEAEKHIKNILKHCDASADAAKKLNQWITWYRLAGNFYAEWSQLDATKAGNAVEVYLKLLGKTREEYVLEMNLREFQPVNNREAAHTYGIKDGGVYLPEAWMNQLLETVYFTPRQINRAITSVAAKGKNSHIYLNRLKALNKINPEKLENTLTQLYSKQGMRKAVDLIVNELGLNETAEKLEKIRGKKACSLADHKKDKNPAALIVDRPITPVRLTPIREILNPVGNELFETFYSEFTSSKKGIEIRSPQEKVNKLLEHFNRRFRYPVLKSDVETLISEGCGDCIASALLYAKMCYRLGVEAEYMHSYDHTFNRVRIGEEIVFVDATPGTVKILSADDVKKIDYSSAEGVGEELLKIIAVLGEFSFRKELGTEELAVIKEAEDLNNKYAYYALGKLYLSLKDKRKALEYFIKASDLDPQAEQVNIKGMALVAEILSDRQEPEKDGSGGASPGLFISKNIFEESYVERKPYGDRKGLHYSNGAPPIYTLNPSKSEALLVEVIKESGFRPEGFNLKDLVILMDLFGVQPAIDWLTENSYFAGALLGEDFFDEDIASHKELLLKIFQVAKAISEDKLKRWNKKSKLKEIKVESINVFIYNTLTYIFSDSLLQLRAVQRKRDKLAPNIRAKKPKETKPLKWDKEGIFTEQVRIKIDRKKLKTFNNKRLMASDAARIMKQELRRNGENPKPELIIKEINKQKEESWKNNAAQKESEEKTSRKKFDSESGMMPLLPALSVGALFGGKNFSRQEYARIAREKYLKLEFSGLLDFYLDELNALPKDEALKLVEQGRGNENRYGLSAKAGGITLVDNLGEEKAKGIVKDLVLKNRGGAFIFYFGEGNRIGEEVRKYEGALNKLSATVFVFVEKGSVVRCMEQLAALDISVPFILVPTKGEKPVQGWENLSSLMKKELGIVYAFVDGFEGAYSLLTGESYQKRTAKKLNELGLQTYTAKDAGSREKGDPVRLRYKSMTQSFEKIADSLVDKWEKNIGLKADENNPSRVYKPGVLSLEEMEAGLRRGIESSRRWYESTEEAVTFCSLFGAQLMSMGLVLKELRETEDKALLDQARYIAISAQKTTYPGEIFEYFIAYAFPEILSLSDKSGSLNNLAEIKKQVWDFDKSEKIRLGSKNAFPGDRTSPLLLKHTIPMLAQTSNSYPEFKIKLDESIKTLTLFIEQGDYETAKYLAREGLIKIGRRGGISKLKESIRGEIEFIIAQAEKGNDLEAARIYSELLRDEIVLEKIVVGIFRAQENRGGTKVPIVEDRYIPAYLRKTGISIKLGNINYGSIAPQNKASVKKTLSVPNKATPVPPLKLGTLASFCHMLAEGRQVPLSRDARIWSWFEANIPAGSVVEDMKLLAKKGLVGYGINLKLRNYALRRKKIAADLIKFIESDVEFTNRLIQTAEKVKARENNLSYDDILSRGMYYFAFAGHSRLKDSNKEELLRFISSPQYTEPNRYPVMDEYIIKEGLKNAKKAVVLDIGCAADHPIRPAVNTIKLAEKIKKSKLSATVIGLDIEVGAIRKKKKSGKIKLPGNLEIISANTLKLPFKASSVQAVKCSAILHLLAKEDAVLAFNEIGRVLKPGGILVTDFEIEEQDTETGILVYEKQGINLVHTKTLPIPSTLNYLINSTYLRTTDAARNKIKEIKEAINKPDWEEGMMPAMGTTASQNTSKIQKSDDLFTPESIVLMRLHEPMDESQPVTGLLGYIKEEFGVGYSSTEKSEGDWLIVIDSRKLAHLMGAKLPVIEASSRKKKNFAEYFDEKTKGEAEEIRKTASTVIEVWDRGKKRYFAIIAAKNYVGLDLAQLLAKALNEKQKRRIILPEADESIGPSRVQSIDAAVNDMVGTLSSMTLAEEEMVRRLLETNNGEAFFIVHPKYMVNEFPKQAGTEAYKKYLARIREVFTQAKTPVFVLVEENKLLKARKRFQEMNPGTKVILIATKKDTARSTIEGWEKTQERLGRLGLKKAYLGGEIRSGCVKTAKKRLSQIMEVEVMPYLSFDNPRFYRRKNKEPPEKYNAPYKHLTEKATRRNRIDPEEAMMPAMGFPFEVNATGSGDYFESSLAALKKRDPHIINYKTTLGSDYVYLGAAQEIYEELIAEEKRGAALIKGLWGYKPVILYHAITRFAQGAAREEIIGELREMHFKGKNLRYKPAVGGEIEVNDAMAIDDLDVLKDLSQYFGIPDGLDDSVLYEFAQNPNRLASAQIIQTKLLKKYLLPGGMYSYHINLFLPYMESGEETEELKVAASIMQKALIVLYTCDNRLNQCRQVNQEVRAWLYKNEDLFRVEVRFGNVIKDRKRPELCCDAGMADEMALSDMQSLGMILNAMHMQKRMQGNREEVGEIISIWTEFRNRLEDIFNSAGMAGYFSSKFLYDELIEQIKEKRKTLQLQIGPLVRDTTEKLNRIEARIPQEKRTKKTRIDWEEAMMPASGSRKESSPLSVLGARYSKIKHLLDSGFASSPDLSSARKSLLDSFRGVAGAAKKAAGHDFDVVVYPASGCDLSSAVWYANSVVTVSDTDLFAPDRDISIAAGDILVLAGRKLFTGMLYNEDAQGLNSYLAELAILGVDASTIRLVEEEADAGQSSDGTIVKTTVEFMLGERRIKHTHYNYHLGKKFPDGIIKSELEKKISGKKVVLLSKAGSENLPLNGQLINQSTDALYSILAAETVIVSDNYGEGNKFQGTEQGMIFEDLSESVKGDLQSLENKLINPPKYGYTNIGNLKVWRLKNRKAASLSKLEYLGNEKKKCIMADGGELWVMDYSLKPNAKEVACGLLQGRLGGKAIVDTKILLYPCGPGALAYELSKRAELTYAVDVSKYSRMLAALKSVGIEPEKELREIRMTGGSDAVRKRIEEYYGRNKNRVPVHLKIVEGDLYSLPQAVLGVDVTIIDDLEIVALGPQYLYAFEPILATRAGGIIKQMPWQGGKPLRIFGLYLGDVATTEISFRSHRFPSTKVVTGVVTEESRRKAILDMNVLNLLLGNKTKEKIIESLSLTEQEYNESVARLIILEEGAEEKKIAALPKKEIISHNNEFNRLNGEKIKAINGLPKDAFWDLSHNWEGFASPEQVANDILSDVKNAETKNVLLIPSGSGPLASELGKISNQVFAVDISKYPLAVSALRGTGLSEGEINGLGRNAPVGEGREWLIDLYKERSQEFLKDVHFVKASITNIPVSEIDVTVLNDIEQTIAMYPTYTYAFEPILCTRVGGKIKQLMLDSQSKALEIFNLYLSDVKYTRNVRHMVTGTLTSESKEKAVQDMGVTNLLLGGSSLDVVLKKTNLTHKELIDSLNRLKQLGLKGENYGLLDLGEPNLKSAAVSSPILSEIENRLLSVGKRLDALAGGYIRGDVPKIENIAVPNSSSNDARILLSVWGQRDMLLVARRKARKNAVKQDYYSFGGAIVEGLSLGLLKSEKLEDEGAADELLRMFLEYEAAIDKQIADLSSPGVWEKYYSENQKKGIIAAIKAAREMKQIPGICRLDSDNPDDVKYLNDNFAKILLRISETYNLKDSVEDLKEIIIQLCRGQPYAVDFNNKEGTRKIYTHNVALTEKDLEMFAGVSGTSIDEVRGLKENLEALMNGYYNLHEVLELLGRILTNMAGNAWNKEDAHPGQVNQYISHFGRFNESYPIELGIKLLSEMLGIGGNDLEYLIYTQDLYHIYPIGSEHAAQLMQRRKLEDELGRKKINANLPWELNKRMIEKFSLHKETLNPFTDAKEIMAAASSVHGIIEKFGSQKIADIPKYYPEELVLKLLITISTSVEETATIIESKKLLYTIYKAYDGLVREEGLVEGTMKKFMEIFPGAGNALK